MIGIKNIKSYKNIRKYRKRNNKESNLIENTTKFLLSILLFFALFIPMEETLKRKKEETFILTGEADATQYKHFILDNGVKVVLASNKDFDKGAIAVSMGIGSMEDPWETNGLSHFLEHMLFMGSEKYPSENAFMEFVAKNGGYTNAYTAGELTCYYCDAEKTKLKELVDLLSGFFTCPLLKKEGVERELNAVNSEYLMRKTSQACVEWECYKEFMRNNVLNKKFGCGNLETLKKENIHEEVVKHYKKFYSSDKCCVVICGNNSLEELEEMAGVFKNVKKNEEMKNFKRNSQVDIFEEKYLNNFIKSEAISEKEDLVIKIAIDSHKKLYRENVLGFLGHIFTNKEKGNLLSILQNKQLAFNLHFDHEDLDACTLVIIKVQMISLDKKDEVIQLIYDFLNKIEEKASEEEYERISSIHRHELKYAPKYSAIDLAEEMCSNLQTYDFMYSLYPNYVMEKYDKELISKTINELKNWKKWMIFGFTQTFTEEEKKNLKISKLHKELKYLVTGEKIKINENKEKTEEETFVKNSIPGISSDKIIEGVELIENDLESYDFSWQGKQIKNEGNMFFVFDKDFKQPKGIVKIVLKNTEPSFKIYLNTMKKSFEEKYAREIENNFVNVSSCFNPLFTVITFEGFNKNILKFVELFFRNDYLNSNLFGNEITKRKVDLKKHINSSPFKFTIGRFKKILHGKLSIEEELKVVEKLKEVEPVDFKNISFDLLVTGNLNLEDVRNLKENLLQLLCKQKVVYAEKENSLKNKFTFKTNDKENNVLHRFYKIKKGEEHLAALYEFCCKETFFDQLRTQEQLGYVVQAFNVYDMKQMYATFRVQSEKHVEFLRKRFDKFMKDSKEKIQTMDNETFENYKNGLLCALREKKTNLSGVSSFNLFIYETYGGNFGKHEEKINEIEKINLEELKNYELASNFSYEIESERF
ncbi:ptrA [Ecytonucleospora hepatopenaei]|uniref:PtrA n=1 Tax=Ecytonucleospora hepatopenaei TaxID=646526 RepID=A0A1W0E850_9MICR|nr:ptrA [Ecytonucleospora hepatopenaei]